MADESTRRVQNGMAAHVRDGREDPGAVKEPSGLLDPARQVMIVKSRDVLDRDRKEGVPARVGERRRGSQDGGLRGGRESVKPAREVVQDCTLEVTRWPAPTDCVGVVLEGERKSVMARALGPMVAGRGVVCPRGRGRLREWRGPVCAAGNSSAART